MVPFPKQKATVLEIGIALSQFPRDDLSSLLDKLPAGIDRQLIHDELVYLLTFIVDYATSLSLGNNNTVTNALLSVYYFKLKEMAKEEIFSADFYENMVYKHSVYTNAVNTPHQNGTPYAVGKAFAELCGAYLDIQMTMFGSTIFVNWCESISKFLKSYQIIE